MDRQSRYLVCGGADLLAPAAKHPKTGSSTKLGANYNILPKVFQAMRR
jgi:hypothetical protein